MNRAQRRKAEAIERNPNSKHSKPLNSHGNHKLFVKATNTRRKVVKK